MKHIRLLFLSALLVLSSACTTVATTSVKDKTPVVKYVPGVSKNPYLTTFSPKGKTDAELEAEFSGIREAVTKAQAE
jgi:ABC-type oligopeptide transport system substrate-binding subunit